MRCYLFLLISRPKLICNHKRQSIYFMFFDDLYR
jgi:hypothetical protein